MSWSPEAMALSPLLLSLVCEFHSNDRFPGGKKKDPAFILGWVITSVGKKLAV